MNRRFLCPDLPAAGQSVTLSEPESYHLRTILRLRQEEEITLLNGRGSCARAIAKPPSNRRQPVTCSIIDVTQHEPPPVRLVLAVAPPRGKAMGRIVRQATELGVAEIRPIQTAFGVSRPDTEATGHWRTDAGEAIKQSGNPFLPHVAEIAEFADAVAEMAAPAYVGWAPGKDHGQAVPPPIDRSTVEAAGQLWLWIGPEGGFNDHELETLKSRQAQPLAIGRWILRVETAVVGALAWIVNQYQ